MSYAKFDLSGKTAVVIGGTSGIGRAIAHGLAESGATVVPTSHLEEHVEETAAEFEAAGRRTIRVVSDVTDRDSLENLLDKSVEAFGQIHILINSAGITKRHPTLDFPEEDWNRIMDINLNGTLRACQVFGRHMIENGYGRIVNIASLSTFVSLFEVAAYAASKAAVASLTKSLAIEWAKHGINVNAIAPGNFPTPLNRQLLLETDRGREFLTRTPMKRFGQVEELAGAAIYLSSDAASYTTGSVMVVDGGFLASGVNQ
ncbi:MAG: glucose 1-dehydrogenase [Acidobacteriota bacterium]|nr:glucose 1-dehydrogenase [Acidobacteriota bacterium]